ncbi:hypothetical protein A462_27498 [Pseudomonas sp. Ag1]|nr:hypothetical protein A462_27498 [Pseudomonas sp. Ag1]
MIHLTIQIPLIESYITTMLYTHINSAFLTYFDEKKVYTIMYVVFLLHYFSIVIFTYFQQS